jgi:hypothetical protein
VKNPEDWYGVNTGDIKKIGGGYVLSRFYENSILKALNSVYPNIRWQPWRFHTYFLDASYNHKIFFDHLRDHLGITMDSLEWYRLSVDDLEKYGGPSVTIMMKNFYKNSLYKALTFNYPEIKWHPWKFRSDPRSFWAQPDLRKSFVNYLLEKCKISKRVPDLYDLRLRNFEEEHCLDLVSSYFRSIHELLSDVYPDIDLQPWKAR